MYNHVECVSSPWRLTTAVQDDQFRMLNFNNPANITDFSPHSPHNPIVFSFRNSIPEIIPLFASLRQVLVMQKSSNTYSRFLANSF